MDGFHGTRTGALRPPSFPPQKETGRRIVVLQSEVAERQTASTILLPFPIVSWFSGRPVPASSLSYHAQSLSVLVLLVGVTAVLYVLLNESYTDESSETNVPPYRFAFLALVTLAAGYVTAVLEAGVMHQLRKLTPRIPRVRAFLLEAAFGRSSLIVCALLFRYLHQEALGPSSGSVRKLIDWSWVAVVVGCGLAVRDFLVLQSIARFNDKQHLGGLVHLRFGETLLRDLTRHNPDAAEDGAAGASAAGGGGGAAGQSTEFRRVVAAKVDAFLRALSPARLVGSGQEAAGPPPSESVYDEWLSGEQFEADNAQSEREKSAVPPVQLRQRKESPEPMLSEPSSPKPGSEHDLGEVRELEEHKSEAGGGGDVQMTAPQIGRRRVKQERAEREQQQREREKRKRHRVAGVAGPDTPVLERLCKAIFRTLLPPRGNGQDDGDGGDHLTVEDFERRYESNTAMSAFNFFSTETTGWLTRDDVVGGLARFFELHRTTREHLGDLQTVAQFISSLITFACWFVIVVISLGLLGIDVQSLLLAVSSLMLSFSFALGKTITNTVESMIMLLVVQPFAVGDRIVVRAWNDGKKHWVTRMALTSTHLRDALGNVQIVPNFILAASEITNLSRSVNPGVVIDVEVAFDTPMTKIRGLVDHVGKVLVRDRSSWFPSCAPFVTRLDRTTGMTLSLWLQHRQPASNGLVIAQDTTTVSNEMRNYMDVAGIEWRAPVRRVAMVDEDGRGGPGAQGSEQQRRRRMAAAAAGGGSLSDNDAD